MPLPRLPASGAWTKPCASCKPAASTPSGCIVVAVDNGGSARLDEYSPWRNPQYGGGQGEQYVDFLTQTLKPYIDGNYRTRPDRANTGVAGSSMGGLIATYAAARYPAVFGQSGRVFAGLLVCAGAAFSVPLATPPLTPTPASIS